MHFQVFWEKVCRCHSVGLKFAAVFSLMLNEVVSIGPLHGFVVSTYAQFTHF
jgi:hypothetical protein